MKKDKIIPLKTGEIFFGESEDYQEEYTFYLENYMKNTHGVPSIANRSEFGINTINNIVVDKETEYVTNNFGFRDKNWEGPADIIGAGCSMTYGYGVPVNARWTNILSEITNKNVRNISIPGTSIQEIVLQIISHIKIFGKPKEILCLFPDPFRIIVPTKKNLITVKDSISRPKETVNFSNIEINNKINEKKSYLKKPYFYNDILPLEFPFYFSMMAIHTLEQLCELSNIALSWTSWEENFQNYLLRLENENPFSNFFYNESILVERGAVWPECHSEKKKFFPDYFDNGRDVEAGFRQSHPGYHWHLHAAEIFYENIKNDNFRS